MIFIVYVRTPPGEAYIFCLGLYSEAQNYGTFVSQAMDLTSSRYPDEPPTEFADRPSHLTWLYGCPDNARPYTISGSPYLWY